MSHKRRVRRAFDRAAAGYDAAADLQRRVCDLLLAQLPDLAPARILDAGCGTGYGKALLQQCWPGARCFAADFSPAMIERSGGGVCADVETLPFAGGSFDLYWSSLTFQWCDGPKAMAEAPRVLAPGGRLAVSSLGPGTLGELEASFDGLDAHRHVLAFTPAEELAAACRDAGLGDIRLETHRLTHYLPDVRTLLGQLKALGANQVGAGRRRGLLGRDAWHAIEARYEQRRDASGLPATYEVILCLGIKPFS